MNYVLTYATYQPTKDKSGTGYAKSHLFARDELGKRHIFTIDHNQDSNRPYFFCDPHEFHKVTQSPLGQRFIKQLPPDRFDLFGREIIKAVVDIPGSIPMWKDQFTWTNEGDVEWRYRVLIDLDLKFHFTKTEGRLKPIETSEAQINHGYIDIEVSSPRAIFPQPDKAEYPIVLISLVDWKNNQPICLLLKNSSWIGNPWKKTTYGGKTILFDTEAAMLEYLFVLVRDGKTITLDDQKVTCGEFDTITGWNVWFDISYIYHRAKKLHINPERMSPLGYWYKQGHYEDGWRCGGIELFDGLAAVKKWNESEADLSSWNYQFVKGHFLGEEYNRKSSGGNIQDIWQSDLEELIRYGYEDAVDFKLLFDKLNIWGYFDGIRRLVGVFYPDSLSNLKVVNTWILRKAKSIGICLPSTKYSSKTEGKGAVVFQPPAGLHDWVGVADVKSLYPSLIKTFNLSPETLVPDPIEMREDVPYVSKDKQIKVDYPVVELPNGVRYRTDKKGIVPLIVEEAEEWRDKYRALVRKYRIEGNSHLEQLNDINQNTAKYLSSSIYGVLGNEAYALRSDVVRGCITYMGREQVIPSIKEFLEMHSLDPIYADTDSNFFKIPNVHNFAEAEHVGEEIIKNLNEHLAKKLGTDKIFTKLDKIFERMLFALSADGKRAAKKNYAGLKKDGSINIMGFASKRSDACIITRDAQKTLFNILLKEADIDKAAQAVREMRQRFKDKTIDLDEIAVPRGIDKPLDQYTEAARNHSALRGLEYATNNLKILRGSGSKPKYLYVKRKTNTTGLPNTDVITAENMEDIPPKFWKDFEVDFERQMNLTLRGKVEGILEAVGIDWGEVKTGTRQTGLFDYEDKAQNIKIPEDWNINRLLSLMEIEYGYTTSEMVEMSGLSEKIIETIMEEGKGKGTVETKISGGKLFWIKII